MSSGNRASRISPAKSFAVCGPLAATGVSDRAAVSQFTLLASTKKGSKPDFHGAAGGEQAKLLYESLVARIRDLYHSDRVKDGVFQAMMDVGLVNDGPVTLELEVSPPKVMGKPSSEAAAPASSVSGMPS